MREIERNYKVMPKKENNNKNYSSHKAFIEHQRANRPKQYFYVATRVYADGEEYEYRGWSRGWKH